MSKKRRALSMTEAMYFALVEYTDQLNADLSISKGKDLKPRDLFTPTGVNTKIIIGTLPPIPHSCIERGEELAEQAEKKRESEPPKPKKEIDLEEEFFGGVTSF